MIWPTDKGVFGTWLGYSAEHDVLIQAGSHSDDRAEDEVDRGMVAYRGTDGRVLWSIPETYKNFGPLMLAGDKVITQNSGGGITAAAHANAYNLLTGRLITRTHPLTGETIPWTWIRFKGCNTAIASENLLTFRLGGLCGPDEGRGYGQHWGIQVQLYVKFGDSQRRVECPC